MRQLGLMLLFAAGLLQKMLMTSIAAVADSTVVLPLTQFQVHTHA